MQDRPHSRTTHRARLPSEPSAFLGDRGDATGQSGRDHPHALAYAGYRCQDLKCVSRGHRRAVEYISLARATAFGGQQVASDRVGDVDNADLDVDEDGQLAVEVIDQDLAVPRGASRSLYR